MTAEIIPFNIDHKNDCRGNRYRSFVYVIAAEGSGKVKIGKADNTLRRLKEHQAGSAVKMKIIRTLPGDRSVEGKFHTHFRDARAHGEWFTFTPEMMDFFPAGYIKDNFVIKGNEGGVEEASNSLAVWMVMRMCGLADVADPFDLDAINRRAAKDASIYPEMNDLEKQDLLVSSVEHLLNKVLDRIKMVLPEMTAAEAANHLSGCLATIASYREAPIEAPSGLAWEGIGDAVH